MKRIFLLAIAALCCAKSMAEPARTIRGSGNMVSEVRAVSPVNEITVVGGIKCLIQQSNRPQVHIDADDNVMAHVVVEQRGDELYIGIASGVQLRNAEVSVKVSMPNFSEVNSRAGARVDIGTWSTTKAELECNSGALLKCELITAEEIEANVSSGADIIATVACQKLEAEASSGADMDLDGSASEAELNVSSGADIKAYITYKKLSAVASSGGGIKYRKCNGHVEAHSSSGGSIRAINL